MSYTWSRRGILEQNSKKSNTIVCVAKHAQKLLHTEAFTRKSFHAQKLLQTDTFTHSLFAQRVSHTGPFTHRRFYTPTLLQTDACAHRLHDTDLFTHRHRHFYTQRLLHTETSTHRRFYTQTWSAQVKSQFFLSFCRSTLISRERVAWHK